MTHRIDSCRFQRYEKSKWEPGIVINYGDKSQRLVDSEGQEPEEIWDFRVIPELCLDLTRIGAWLSIIGAWLDQKMKNDRMG